MVSGSLRVELELDSEAELFETCNQPTRFNLDRPAVEIRNTEVVVFSAILEDMIDRREDRSGDGADGFLRATLGLQPEELGSIIAVFGALGGPGALHEHRLEPRGSLAQARSLALAGAFVLSR